MMIHRQLQQAALVCLPGFDYVILICPIELQRYIH